MSRADSIGAYMTTWDVKPKIGIGVGGSSAESGNWCIQSNPPHLVEKHGYGDLRIGDIVACNDVLMDYGKGYYKGAVTVGVVT